MKKLIILSTAIFLFACKNDKKPASAESDKIINGEPPAPPIENTNTEYSSTTNLTYTVEATEIKNSASILVQKDKDKLQAGAPFICMLTSNAAKNNNEYLTVNFLLDTKPGTYPVVGASLNRGKDGTSEMYGGILGGKAKLSNYKVTITECKDLGSNNLGGHKWSISGTCEEVVIKAMGAAVVDKTKNHPQEIKLQKISFTNLSFDDNWDEMMGKAMEQIKKNK
jgi:hypothetical protein